MRFLSEEHRVGHTPARKPTFTIAIVLCWYDRDLRANMIRAAPCSWSSGFRALKCREIKDHWLHTRRAAGKRWFCDSTYIKNTNAIQRTRWKWITIIQSVAGQCVIKVQVAEPWATPLFRRLRLAIKYSLLYFFISFFFPQVDERFTRAFIQVQIRIQPARGYHHSEFVITSNLAVHVCENTMRNYAVVRIIFEGFPIVAWKTWNGRLNERSETCITEQLLNKWNFKQC